MIEVPAAALRAGQMLADVDFLSIGTNDLSQYTFAADRMCGDLADLLDPWQPALLALARRLRGGRRRGGQARRRCGEAAAIPFSRWCSPASASPACRWRPAASRRCAMPWPRTPWTSAARSPRRPLLPPARRQPGRRWRCFAPAPVRRRRVPSAASWFRTDRTESPLTATCCWNQPFCPRATSESHGGPCSNCAPSSTSRDVAVGLVRVPNRSNTRATVGRPSGPPDHLPAVRRSAAAADWLSRAGWSSGRIGRRGPCRSRTP